METPGKPEITVRPLTIADEKGFPQAIEILNRTQGRDLFAPDYLAKLIQSPAARIVGAFKGDEIVGLGVTQLINDFSYYVPFDPSITKELTGKIVGSFSTMAIHEDYQGQGLGQKISQHRLDWVRKQNCEIVVGVSWVSGLKHMSNRVFEKMGFKVVKEVKNFYRESSLQHPFDCPGCQKAPCTCSAFMYRLNLK